MALNDDIRAFKQDVEAGLYEQAAARVRANPQLADRDPDTLNLDRLKYAVDQNNYTLVKAFVDVLRPPCDIDSYNISQSIAAYAAASHGLSESLRALLENENIAPSACQDSTTLFEVWKAIQTKKETGDWSKDSAAPIAHRNRDKTSDGMERCLKSMIEGGVINQRRGPSGLTAILYAASAPTSPGCKISDQDLREYMSFLLSEGADSKYARNFEITRMMGTDEHDAIMANNISLIGELADTALNQLQKRMHDTTETPEQLLAWATKNKKGQALINIALGADRADIIFTPDYWDKYGAQAKVAFAGNLTAALPAHMNDLGESINIAQLRRDTETPHDQSVLVAYARGTSAFRNITSEGL